ncbi:hypothetical protein [Sphingomonas desiccabilis]|uniref:Uncharacterized protein n=1 Tax=Sphingomonas desiccabilis TaxID=429134 RepID=A0A4Q2IYN1_9SPHN|nr:hypothetical protein [Sphingomonas desiccabilis]MBB3909748.1 hypothetical protein [Sphingomonas desiccabilis]RXZ34440.1 hypothetical protein EO081_01740 [Sphingomonas desiccabilis]
MDVIDPKNVRWRTPPCTIDGIDQEREASRFDQVFLLVSRFDDDDDAAIEQAWVGGCEVANTGRKQFAQFGVERKRWAALNGGPVS